jgi:hypothetical protein
MPLRGFSVSLNIDPTGAHGIRGRSMAPMLAQLHSY